MGPQGPLHPLDRMLDLVSALVHQDAQKLQRPGVQIPHIHAAAAKVMDPSLIELMHPLDLLLT